ncbi:MAG: glutamate N-acetyltransferase/amino-acid N-acetyltransferase [Pontimonas sp.]|jgi:glutamate N-acetyltransferase/amino-acid N-acetyltransferase
MSVTAAAGFSAGSVAAGLKASGGLDLCVIVNEGPLSSVAAVFTSNRAQANPILWSKQAIQTGRARAIVLNSGGANCFTGPDGFQLTHATAEKAASLLEDCGPGDIQVCSTGLIGDLLPAGSVLTGVEASLAKRDFSPEAGLDAAHAIMTTDSRAKTAITRITTDHGVVTIGGMAKGAGMLAPGLATMLVVITTDAVMESRELDSALRNATRVSFDRLDSDGCMSTNDQVTLMASGASGISPETEAFRAALLGVCRDLAMQLLSDAEGSSHDIAIEVIQAASEDDAVAVGRAVARSNLFKTAIFGNDPNWGRVLAAIGTVDAKGDVFDIDVSINGVRVCHAGGGDRPRGDVDLTPRDTHVLIDLVAGEHSATIWTNDLTQEYVHENSAYSS